MVRRGFSLVEATIVCGLLALLMSAVYLLLTSGTRYSRQTEAYAYAQREGTILIRTISDEVANSIDHWEGSAGPGPPSFRFLSATPPLSQNPGIQFDPVTGRLVWQKWVCFYYNATDNTVIRSEVPLAPPTASVVTEPTPVAMFPDFQAAPASAQRIVAHNVTNFTVAGGPLATYDFTVVTSYTAAVATNQDQAKQATVTLTGRVHILNPYP